MTCNSHSIPKFLSHPSAQTLHVSVTPVRCTIQRSCLSILAHQNQCGQPYQHTDRSHKFRAERNSIFCKLPARRHRLAHNSALPVPLLGIALTEEAPAWTLDQIAGLVFGGIMLASVLLATKVDVFIARAQRRDLGLCEECGGLNDPESCDSSRCPYGRKQS